VRQRIDLIAREVAVLQRRAHDVVLQPCAAIVLNEAIQDLVRDLL
jgi:hypothetical protein